MAYEDETWESMRGEDDLLQPAQYPGFGFVLFVIAFATIPLLTIGLLTVFA